MREVYITAIATALPNDPVGNDQMEAILGQAGEKPSKARKVVLRSNGIKSRHYAKDPQSGAFTHSNATLTAEAITNLKNDGVDPQRMTLLACGTTMADQLMPGHALMTQAEVGVSGIEAVSTAGICLSGITALQYARNAIKSGEHEQAVCTGSEIASAILSGKNFKPEIEQKVAQLSDRPEIAFEKDFLRWMLSDGAGAFWLAPRPAPGKLSLKIDWVEILSYAAEEPVCMYSGLQVHEDGTTQGWRELTPDEWNRESLLTVRQNVKLLNEKIIYYTVEKPLRTIMQKHPLKAEAVDYFLPHYSSEYFRDKVHEGMKKAGLDIPQDRWFTNLTTKGNTGSASIYIILEELFHSGQLKPGDRLLCYIPESGRFSTAFMHLSVVKP